MHVSARLLAAVMLTAMPVVVRAAPAMEPPSGQHQRLESAVRRLSQLSGGDLGLTAMHLDSGWRFDFRADESFPMASTFKVAVAGAVLSEVDAGRLQLTQLVSIPPAKRVSSAVIAERFIHPGLQVSVANLLELMLTQSDNSATDALLVLAGGPPGVTAWLGRNGITDQRVDRDTAGILRDYFQLPPGPFNTAFEAARSRPGFDPDAYVDRAHFNRDRRDHTTPRAMADLLAALVEGRLLTPSSTALLTSMMARCRTGDRRLKGRLPPGTPIAHKTGSIGGTANDVGVVMLPDGTRLVLAVFVKASRLGLEAREDAIAEIARTIYDYVLLVPHAPDRRAP